MKKAITTCGNCGAILTIDMDKPYYDGVDFRREINGEWVKRSPGKGGVLPLTGKELKELDSLLLSEYLVHVAPTTKVTYGFDKLWQHDGRGYVNTITNIKAVMWLAKRFRFDKENKDEPNN